MKEIIQGIFDEGVRMTERSVFLEALEKENLQARAAYLDTVCAGKHAFRERIESLLRDYAEMDTFLEVPALEQISVADQSLKFLAPPRIPGALGKLDHYDILEVVGRGSTGVILKAKDSKLQRIVAIKVLNARLASSPQARERFVREAQAAAAVRDDHVVAIHAVHDEGPVPYLVMEYISGMTLGERLKQEKPLELKEVLRIGMQMASGLAAAHAQGLIHRDIKPGNILLENGVQRVKITDFGLAQLVEGGASGSVSGIAGTPIYMSPEQARGEALDQQTDLFSLGSVLYTICAGQPPFTGQHVAEILKNVVEQEPKPLRLIKPDTPEWLCHLVARLHTKKPKDRNITATEVAEVFSLELARLQKPFSSTGSSSQRHNTGYWGDWKIRTASFAVFLALMAAAVSWWYHRSEHLADLNDEALLPTGPVELRREDIPQELLKLAGQGDSAKAPKELVGILGSGRFNLPETGRVGVMATSPDGKWLAVPLENKVILYDATQGEYRRQFKAFDDRIDCLAFSNDGRTLAAMTRHQNAIRVWEWPTGKELFFRKLSGPKISARLLFSVDGKRLYAEGNQSLLTLEVPSGRVLQDLPLKSGVSWLSVSPDGRFLAVGLWEARCVKVFQWNNEGLEEVRSLSGFHDTVASVAFSSDSQYLAAGSFVEIKWWNTQTFEEISSQPASAQELLFSPDHILFASSAIASPKSVHTFTRWNASGQEVSPSITVEVAEQRVWARHILSYDGRILFAARGDYYCTHIRSIDTASGQERFPRQGHIASIWALAASPGGRFIASAGIDRVVHVWDLQTRQLHYSLKNQPDTVSGLAFSPDGKWLASGSKAGFITLYETREGKPVRLLHDHSRSPSAIRFSPDSRHLAAGNEYGAVQIWDPRSGSKVSTLSGHKGVIRCVAYSRDGKYLASGGEDKCVLVHDLTTRTSRKFSTSHGVNGVSFSSDGSLLASVEDGPGDNVHLWNLKTGEPLLLHGHKGHVFGVAFSPSKHILATCGEDGTVRLWNCSPSSNNAVRVFGPDLFGGEVRDVAFTPDGKYLMTANANGFAYVFEVDH